MKTDYRKWISKRLKFFRETKQLSQSEMAIQLNLLTPTYKAYEEGRSEPSIYTLQRICKVCGITVDKFLEESPVLTS